MSIDFHLKLPPNYRKILKKSAGTGKYKNGSNIR